MNAKFKVLVILFLFTMVCASDVFAQLPSAEVESLRGIKGAYVIILDLEPDIEKDGLRKDQIKTDVELKLRLAGIKGGAKNSNGVEWLLKEPGGLWLQVSVGSIKLEIGSYIYDVAVVLHQMVYLERNTKIKISAETWRRDYFGIVGENEVADVIRNSIKDLMDEFINDYLTVNPK